VLPVIRQLWREVAFLHWPFEPQVVQRALPRQLVVETYDGMAWISIVCFATTCSIGGVAPLPGPRCFPETNVRTYVRGRDGKDGLYFFSLDVTNRANVLCGRATGLRYRLGDMRMQIDDEWSYEGVRRRDPDAGYEIVVQPRSGDVASPLDVFLTARWSGYPCLGGHVIRYDVHHQQWPLRPASAIRCDQTLLTAEGLPAPTGEPRVHVSSGVDVNLAPHRIIW
jgi:uncharacterized protein